MQPNQQQNVQSDAQNQSGINASSNPPYNVPDYLGIDSITQTRSNKFSKKLRYLLLSLVVICGLVLSATFLFGNLKLSNEDKLYKSLGSLLQTSFIHRDIILDNPKYRGAINISVDSNFLVPENPKSSLSYTYDGLKNLNKDAPGGPIVGQLVTVDNDLYAGRITSTPIDLMKNLELNKWYRGSLSKPSIKDPDVFGVYADTNSPVNSLVLGNYGDKKAEQILSLIKTSDVYKIQSTKTEKKDDNSETVYLVKVDFQKLRNLVIKINDSFGLKLKTTTITSGNNIEIAISNKTDKIIRIKESIKQGDFQAIVETRFSYPENILITVPTDINVQAD